MASSKIISLSAVAAGIMLSLGAAHAAPLLGATEATTIKASELAAKEKALTDFPLMNSVKSSIQTLSNSDVEKIEAGRAANAANVKRVESMLTEKDWEYLFPMRAPEYTYANFLKAIGKFPAVCGTYTDGRDSDAICRKSLATMFAHFAQETGGHESWRDIPEWRQALVYLREMGWVEGQKGGYNGECNPDIWQGQTWPCGKDKDGDYLSYFGRGAKQLSYNYNYGPFSDAMYGGDVRPLLDKPELVADTWMNLASAVFFFVYPQPPKPSMLHVIDGTWQPNDHDKANGLVDGFGVTIQIINGGVECGGAAENAQSLNRIAYYKEFANYLKVPIADDEVLGCKNMKQFDEGGAGALPIYWEMDWGWSAETPDGKTNTCQLVGYQTPYSAFKEGDYTKCVQKHFNVNVVDDNGEADTAADTTEDTTPAPTVNVAPVAQIAGPVGAVEAGSQVSLSAAGSTDANGDKLSYTWMSQDGQTLSGQDKAVISFAAPESDKDAQYVVSMTVSDGSLSTTTTYTLNVKAKAAGTDDATGEDESGSVSYPSWSARQTWKAGDIVNNHGALYQCKPLPEGAWCNVAPTYYEPGAGIAWGDAWKAM
ncbi:glycoside hydrolase family 19 protein [Kluyvera intermedia]|uniref:Glycoside hydrolase family 19 protein n=1 Tax=Kluyvera intermedia TaxID=61648 RepID=A0AA95FYW7_KLUIN|nr:glycoside hydrolase family 19 protein [Kluyvera intermedia]WGL55478.1 glycoside hydrolase family 19 protein [Kluyvera intermedia]